MAEATRTAAINTAIPQKMAERKSASLWSDAWKRLLKNRGSVIGMITVAFFMFVAIFAPFLAPHNPQDMFPGESYKGAVWDTGDSRFILGTDTIGRDVLSRVIFGARTSLAVGFIPLGVILLIGMTVGMAAGYFGGRTDNVLMRLTDIVYAFPDILFFIIMITALRDTWIGQLLNGFVLLFVALALVTWVTVARLMRGQVLAVKERDYVEAARSIGSSNGRIMLRHILPNSLAPIIVAAAFIVPAAILAEAILGFLGIGIRPTTDPNAVFPTSWGTLLLDGRVALQAQIWILIPPAICIAVIMLAFTFIGDGLRDALDPMMKGRS
ncbi:MAG: ABC transporter permease [Chloroflexi bacterium]|nr:ABC transporter permease [Chloroflexota bacterium]